jgi:hypothetical protein
MLFVVLVLVLVLLYLSNKMLQGLVQKTDLSYLGTFPIHYDNVSPVNINF